MTRRYAEDTKVTTDQSQQQVKTLLRRAGAGQLAAYESAEKSAIAFRIGAHFYRVTVPIVSGAKDAQQEERRAWRLLLLLIKAKLEAIREGATTFEREFLADMMLYDGSTVGEWAAVQVEEARKLGQMPRSLMIEGPRKVGAG